MRADAPDPAPVPIMSQTLVLPPSAQPLDRLPAPQPGPMPVAPGAPDFAAQLERALQGGEEIPESPPPTAEVQGRCQGAEAWPIAEIPIVSSVSVHPESGIDRPGRQSAIRAIPTIDERAEAGPAPAPDQAAAATAAPNPVAASAPLVAQPLANEPALPPRTGKGADRLQIQTGSAVATADAGHMRTSSYPVRSAALRPAASAADPAAAQTPIAWPSIPPYPAQQGPDGPSSAAPAAAAFSMDMRADGWAARLAHEILSARDCGATGLSLHLAPRHLGSLDIGLSESPAGLVVELRPSSEAAAALIAREQPHLLDELRQRGIPVAETALHFGANGHGRHTRNGAIPQPSQPLPDSDRLPVTDQDQHRAQPNGRFA